MATETSYFDLYVTTPDIPRTRLADLPFRTEVSCNRVGGWCLWRNGSEQLAGEFHEKWLMLDVSGHLIIDSRPEGDSDGD